MVRWVVGLMLHGGPIEQFLVPASAPRLVLKCHGMFDHVCVMMPLLLFGKRSPSVLYHMSDTI